MSVMNSRGFEQRLGPLAHRDIHIGRGVYAAAATILLVFGACFAIGRATRTNGSAVAHSSALPVAPSGTAVPASLGSAPPIDLARAAAQVRRTFVSHPSRRGASPAQRSESATTAAPSPAPVEAATPAPPAAPPPAPAPVHAAPPAPEPAPRPSAPAGGGRGGSPHSSGGGTFESSG